MDCPVTWVPPLHRADERPPHQSSAGTDTPLLWDLAGSFSDSWDSRVSPSSPGQSETPDKNPARTWAVWPPLFPLCSSVHCIGPLWAPRMASQHPPVLSEETFPIFQSHTWIAQTHYRLEIMAGLCKDQDSGDNIQAEENLHRQWEVSYRMIRSPCHLRCLSKVGSLKDSLRSCQGTWVSSRKHPDRLAPSHKLFETSCTLGTEGSNLCLSGCDSFFRRPQWPPKEDKLSPWLQAEAARAEVMIYLHQ